MLKENENKTKTNKQRANLIWPSGQAIPTFPEPASTFYTIQTNFNDDPSKDLDSDDRVMLSALQGFVNSEMPQILLTEDGDVPADTWPNTFNIQMTKLDTEAERYSLVSQFKNSYLGFVIYDLGKSTHYKNAASTIGNVNNYLPVTSNLMAKLTAIDPTLDAMPKIDITIWTDTTSLAIYTKIYDDYWNAASRRLLISANPDSDWDHTRDMGAATGAAVLYLDCTKVDEKNLYEKFMKDMADNANETALILGWYTTERSGITSGSAYGISTLPADLYISSTVYSVFTNQKGLSRIDIPTVPKRETLQNKVYIAMFMSDGDNIQYDQRAFRKSWDDPTQQAARGQVPINYTISPGLVDIGPGILNYYYQSATDKECFVTGPSGMGYLMPINTNSEPGAPSIDVLTNTTYMNNYTNLTNTYLQGSGLRAITIWDNASEELREKYAENCVTLNGLTVQNFGDHPDVEVDTSIANGELPFIANLTWYADQYQWLYDQIAPVIQAWDGNSPLFISCSVSSWGLKPSDLVTMLSDLNLNFNNQVEYLRADHFFSMYNEAKGATYNLTLNQSTSFSSSDVNADVNNAVDGTSVTYWTAENIGDKWIQFDFNNTFALDRFIIWQDSTAPADSFKLQISEDSIIWEDVNTWANTGGNVVFIDLESSVSTNYARIVFETANADVSIAEIEIYGGKNIKPPVLNDATVEHNTTTNAVLTFTSNKPGNYYYSVLDATSPAPDAVTVKATGIQGNMVSGANTINIMALTFVDKKVYLVGEDTFGNLSTVLALPIYGAIITGITVTPTSFSSSGGTATVTVTGTNLNIDAIQVYDGVDLHAASGDNTSVNCVLDFPVNTSQDDIIYTVSAYQNSVSTEKSTTVTVTKL